MTEEAEVKPATEKKTSLVEPIDHPHYGDNGSDFIRETSDEFFEEVLWEIIGTSDELFLKRKIEKNFLSDVMKLVLKFARKGLLERREAGQDVSLKNVAEHYIEKNSSLDQNLVGAMIVILELAEKGRIDRQNDELTKIGNRRKLNRDLLNLLESGRGEDREFCFLMIDLDYFKEINDRYGHTIGDLVLEEVARALGKCVRKSDCAYRFGGDEFAVLASKTNMEGGEALLKKINDVLNELVVSVSEEIKIRVSASVGLAFCDKDEQCTIQDIIDEADAMLYKNKANRKGEVVQGEDDDVPQSKPAQSYKELEKFKTT